MNPKTLLFDIETFPTVIESFEVYEANYLRILRPTTIAAFCAKWLDSKKCVTRALCDYPGYKPVKAPCYGPVDDSKLVKDIWDLLDKADIVIAHNGNRFDVKKVNARFETHGLPPPSPYQKIDTLLEGRKIFGYDSHRLNERGKQLDVGEKEDNGGKKTWEKCLEGDMRAWHRMKKYNRQDVILLEKVYKADRGWYKTCPNLGNYIGRAVCPHCSSKNTEHRGIYINKTTQYNRIKCNNCGGWSREQKNLQKVKLLVNV